jgi:hypothetical protein
VMGAVLADRAKQRSREFTVPMGADDEEIGLFGCIHQYLCGPSLADARVKDHIGIVALDNCQDVAEQLGRVSRGIIVGW